MLGVRGINEMCEVTGEAVSVCVCVREEVMTESKGEEKGAMRKV